MATTDANQARITSGKAHRDAPLRHFVYCKECGYTGPLRKSEEAVLNDLQRHNRTHGNA